MWKAASERPMQQDAHEKAPHVDACAPPTLLPLAGMQLSLDAEVAGVVSEAEDAVRSLNSDRFPL